MTILGSLRDSLSLFKVDNKVALITGASGAFGRACALALGATGTKLVLVSGSAEELKEVRTRPEIRQGISPLERRRSACGA